MREVEVKYRVADPESLLAALRARGVALGSPALQDDQAYAPRGWAYGDDRDGVPFARLRTAQGRHLFTLKRPQGSVLSCEEHETDIADRDQMHAAIVAMGFYPTVRIVKVRRTASWQGMTLCVDELPGLGTFLEVERMVGGDIGGDAVQAGLCRFVESLGVTVERTEQTYDWLVRHHHGVRPGAADGRTRGLLPRQNSVPPESAAAVSATSRDGGGLTAKAAASAE